MTISLSEAFNRSAQELPVALMRKWDNQNINLCIMGIHPFFNGSDRHTTIERRMSDLNEGWRGQIAQSTTLANEALQRASRGEELSSEAKELYPRVLELFERGKLIDLPFLERLQVYHQLQVDNLFSCGSLVPQIDPGNELGMRALWKAALTHHQISLEEIGGQVERLRPAPEPVVPSSSWKETLKAGAAYVGTFVAGAIAGMGCLHRRTRIT